jgi:mannose-6-phosphate isomerase-like protein (cupin superfamily)
VHHDADEAIYLLEGAVECRVGSQTISATPGAVVLIPRGTWHALANVGSAPARFLVILSPPGFEQYWAKVADVLAVASGPPDADAMLALQQQYQMESRGQPRRFD